MAEMIDILNKLREYETQGHEVSDAIKSTEMTQTEKPVQEHCHSFQDFLKRENLPPVEKMNFTDYAKAAEMYAKHKAEMAKEESVKEGGMSDIHIGAQEFIGNYTTDDGDLKMPKAEVMKAMSAEKDKASFPQSYEIETAMKMVADKFDDAGKAVDETIETTEEKNFPYATDKEGAGFIMANKSKIIPSLFAGGVQNTLDPKDAVKAISDLMPDVTEQEIMDLVYKAGYMSKESIEEAKPDFLDLDKDGNKTEPMKKAAKDKEMKKETVKEDMHIMTDSPEEMGMMMTILKLAGVKPVDAKMMGAEQPADETELANSPAGYTNDQKVQSVDDLVNLHSGGLNRQKVQVKKGHPGDNELTAEDIANSLTAQYESFKKQYQVEATKATENKK